MVLLAYGDNWVRLSAGDLVDASTTRGDIDYFFLGLDSDGSGNDPSAGLSGRTDYDIAVPATGNSSFYLGFVTANDLWDGSTTVPEVCFGWVEIAVDNGTVSVVRSALDVSGAPLVVGQVPEPSAACLAALGAAAMLRRRKKWRQSPAKGVIARR